MWYEDNDTEALKQWVEKRLDNVSDADSEVLADYVLALVKNDETEEVVRASCEEQLGDFIFGETPKFINDLFTTLKKKSYKPAYASPKPAVAAISNRTPAGLTNLTGNPRQNGLDGSGRGGTGSGKKRSYQEHQDAGPQSPGRQDRPMKQTRRGRRGGDNAHLSRNSGTFQQMQNMPTPPPGFPAFDPNNPMATMLAMQQLGFPVPGFNQDLPPMDQGVSTARIAERCTDYDTKGYCAAGSLCPYEHGSDQAMATANEYDPSNASLIAASLGGGPSPGSRGGRGGFANRGRGRGHHNQHNNRGRATFSSAVPNQDRSNSTIVVEQIPEDKFSEEAVREFFSDFGEIESTEMQPYKRLSVIKFKDFSSAKAAFDSPKVIFDNRFVKVYWYKPEKAKPHGHANSKASNPTVEQPPQEDVEMEVVDPEELAKKQEEAQRAFEERKKKQEETERLRQELKDKAEKQREEHQRLLKKLAEKTGEPMPASAPVQDSNMTDAGSTSAPKATSNGKADPTETLQAKLAELEAEASRLGMDPHVPSPSYTPFPNAYRGRGRGRGGLGSAFQPRGRGGFYNARGGWQKGTAAVTRLDNRPRNLKVTALDNSAINFASGGSHEEALREALFAINTTATITPIVSSLPTTTSDESKAASSASGRKDAAILSFEQRYQADIFLDKCGTNIPTLGKVKVEWVANAAVVGLIPSPAAVSAPTTGAGNGAGAAMSLGMGASVSAGAPANASAAVVNATTPESKASNAAGMEVEMEMETEKDMATASEKNDENGAAGGDKAGDKSIAEGKGTGTGKTAMDYDVADADEQWMR